MLQIEGRKCCKPLIACIFNIGRLTFQHIRNIKRHHRINFAAEIEKHNS